MNYALPKIINKLLRSLEIDSSCEKLNNIYLIIYIIGNIICIIDIPCVFENLQHNRELKSA